MEVTPNSRSPRAASERTPSTAAAPPARFVGADHRALKFGGKLYTDGRSWVGRRCRTLTAEFIKRLGLPADSPLIPQLKALAELQTISEMQRAQLLAGQDGVNQIDRCIRLEGAVRRRMRRLGLDKLPQEPAPPTIAELMLAAAEQQDRSDEDEEDKEAAPP